MDPIHISIIITLAILVAAAGFGVYTKRKGATIMAIDLDKDGVILRDELKAAGKRIGGRYNSAERAELARMLLSLVVSAVITLAAGEKADWTSVGKKASAFGQKVIEHGDRD